MSSVSMMMMVVIMRMAFHPGRIGHDNTLSTLCYTPFGMHLSAVCTRGQIAGVRQQFQDRFYVLLGCFRRPRDGDNQRVATHTGNGPCHCRIGGNLEGSCEHCVDNPGSRLFKEWSQCLQLLSFNCGDDGTSGVTSRIANPVPPDVTTRLSISSSVHCLTCD